MNTQTAEISATQGAVSQRLSLYSAVDDRLTHYDFDMLSGSLSRKATLQMPAKIQYGWRHPTLPILYVSTSNGGPRMLSDRNHVSALAIDPEGGLSFHGDAQPLPRRAVHMCVDPTGQYVLNGHNFPGSGISVHPLTADGRLDPELGQQPALDFGIYPHQVMVFPSGRTAMIVDRGNKAQSGKPEKPGALRTFHFKNGQLTAGCVTAPEGGFGFGPRHVSFHPSQPWLYVSDERFNRLYMFRHDQDRLEPQAAFVCTTLADPDHVRPRQIGGPIHVHPSGRCVYVANRADHVEGPEGAKLFAGGENNIAVYAIDPQSGEPRLLQHAETQSFHVRTFACDPSGQWLVTASIKGLRANRGGVEEDVPATLSVFRIEPDGRLSLVSTHAVETAGPELQYWMGLVG